MRKKVTAVDKAALDISLVKAFLKAARDLAARWDLCDNNFSVNVAVREGRQWRNITDTIFEESLIKGNLTVQAAFDFGMYTFILHYSTEKQYLMGMGFIFKNAQLQTVYGFEEISNVLSRDDFRCHIANELITEDRVLSAFNWLTNLFISIKPKLDVSAMDNEVLEKLMENRSNDQAIFDKRANRAWAELVDMPAIDRAFLMIQEEKYARALDVINSIKGDLTVFESRTLAFLVSIATEAKPRENEVLPSAINGNMMLEKQGRWEIPEVLVVLLSLPFAASIGIVLLISVYHLFYHMVGGIYIVKPDIWLCVVFGAFGSCFFINPIKKIWMRIIFKERYINFKQYKAARSDVLGKRILFILGIIVTAAAVVLFTMFLCCNIVLDEDGMTDNTELLSVRGEFVSYNDIECVYYVNALINYYGDVIETPSVAIKLENGRLINLRPIGMPDEEILLFLQSKSIPMTVVEFIEDIE